jgi:biopolymer transport protein ExbB
MLAPRRSLRARLALAAMQAARTPHWDGAAAREETTRVAKALLAEARTGLRALELIATIAPLIGLLGTVLGMIAAFQALQESGNSADPSVLAGGIWESVAERVQADMEDAATRIFTAPRERDQP